MHVIALLISSVLQNIVGLLQPVVGLLEHVVNILQNVLGLLQLILNILQHTIEDSIEGLLFSFFLSITDIV